MSTRYPAYPNSGGRYGNVQQYDYANWGYIILYLIVLLGSIVGNTLFVWTIKKNVPLRRTAHFFLTALAIRDLIVSLVVVPFVIDSQVVNLMVWNAGDVMCKLYSFLNYGTMAIHSFLVVFLLVFLYFWYRKQEAYMTEDGQTVVRKTRMHKWAIPLACVVGLGIAIPAGALATQSINFNTNVKSCSVWDGRSGSEDAGYKVVVSTVVAAFIVPVLILLFPFIALMMQLCGGRQPRLDPPHSRTAATGIGLIVIFVATRAPFECYELMKLFHQSSLGFKGSTLWGTPYAAWTFDTDIILNCLIYVACALHPILYFALNPDYRSGLVVAWRSLYCNKGSTQREREQASKTEAKNTERQYAAAGSRKPILKQSKQEPLINQQQPIIMPGKKQYQYHPQHYPAHLQQPLLQHQQPPVFQPQQTILFPEHQLQQPQQFYLQPGQQAQPFVMQGPVGDLSFERLSPHLPAVFEYNDFKYIDTARVEPRIAYSPEKTPPKTPETPYFGHNPFPKPYESGGNFINPDIWYQQQLPVINSSTSASGHFEMKPIATSEPKADKNFELETLDGSPGNTLRDRRRIEEMHSPTQDQMEGLQESPGTTRNRRIVTEAQQKSSYIQQPYTNGRGSASMGGSRSSELSRPISPERPSSRSSGVEILITGRTRSRTDLCPEIPRSKYEHSV